jgi:hypothetical protein
VGQRAAWGLRWVRAGTVRSTSVAGDRSVHCAQRLPERLTNSAESSPCPQQPSECIPPVPVLQTPRFGDLHAAVDAPCVFGRTEQHSLKSFSFEPFVIYELIADWAFCCCDVPHRENRHRCRTRDCLPQRGNGTGRGSGPQPFRCQPPTPCSSTITHPIARQPGVKVRPIRERRTLKGLSSLSVVQALHPRVSHTWRSHQVRSTALP